MVRDQITKSVSYICPLCQSQKVFTSFPFQTSHSLSFNVMQCSNCELAWTSPLPDDNDLCVNDFSTYYGKKANKFLGILQKIRDNLMKIRARHYLSLIPKPGRNLKILDIGCAEGRLLNSFLEYGCECTGIEHQAYPEQRFLRRDKIKYFCDNIDSIPLEESSFDLIFLWHVLEHMDNTGLIIKKLSKLLTPEGLLIIAVPNFKSSESKVFKQKWFHLDIPWHKYHFNLNSLKYMAEINRLRVIKVSTFCVEQSVYGLVQSLLNRIGFKRNELYEALKGEIPNGISMSLFFQIIIVSLILIPSLLVSFLIAIAGKGSVVKMVLTPDKEEYQDTNTGT